MGDICLSVPKARSTVELALRLELNQVKRVGLNGYFEFSIREKAAEVAVKKVWIGLDWFSGFRVAKNSAEVNQISAKICSSYA